MTNADVAAYVARWQPDLACLSQDDHRTARRC